MEKLLILFVLFSMNIFSGEPRVVGYSYETPMSAGIDYSSIDYVVGSFVKSDAKGNLTFDSWIDPDDIIAILTKAKESGAVPMIALGTTSEGWEMTKSKTARRNFISQLLTFCDTNGIAGIDLDLEGTAEEFNWGQPGTFFSEPYESLAVELRAAMPGSMILTAAVGSFRRNGAQWTDKFVSELDWINVMIYDRTLSWEGSPVKNHSTYEDHLDAADYWHNVRGVPKEKIVLGVPFYARGWDRENNRMYIEDAGWSVETWGYKYFIKRESIPMDQDTLDIPANDSVLYSRATGVTGRATLFFNSHDLIAKKTAWTIENSYGGMMIWDIGSDLPTSDGRSLLGAIDSVIKHKSSIELPYPLVEMPNNKLNISLSFDKLIFNLPLGDKECLISINDIRGRTIVKKNIYYSGGKATISIGSLSSGFYMVSAKFSDFVLKNGIVLR